MVPAYQKGQIDKLESKEEEKYSCEHEDRPKLRAHMMERRRTK